MRVQGVTSRNTTPTAPTQTSTDNVFPGVPFIRPFPPTHKAGMGGIRAARARDRTDPTTRPGGIYLAPIPTVGLAAKCPP